MTVGTREDLIGRNLVSRETLEKLDAILAELDLWRNKINLIGPREWEQIWPRHVWDSLQLRTDIEPEARIIDLGSGAGFPGLILAASAENAGHVTMIDSVGKKCAFLRAAVERAHLPADIHHGRVEDAPKIPADTVTARAFAPLPKLLDYAAPWLLSGATGLFHKGARWAEELTAARETWDFSCDAIPSASESAGVILKISEVRRVGWNANLCCDQSERRRRQDDHLDQSRNSVGGCGSARAHYRLRRPGQRIDGAGHRL